MNSLTVIRLIKGRVLSVTRKLWFQVGIGILLSLLIIKFFVEVNWLFEPIFIIIKTIFIPLLIGGVLFYITVPLQTFLEKYKFPRWSSILVIMLLLSTVIYVAFTIVGPPIGEQVTLLFRNIPSIVSEIELITFQLIEQVGDLPNWAKDEINKATESIKSFSVGFGKTAVQFSQSVISGTFQG